VSSEKVIAIRSSTSLQALVDEAEATIGRLTAELNALASEEQAAQAVTIIVADCIKRTDVDEAEMIVRIRQMGRLLQHYPIFVVDEVSDPFCGIAGRHKFIPCIAELKAFADKLLHARCERLTRAKTVVQQLSDRRPPLNAEERARRIAMAKDVRERIQATANKLCLRQRRQRTEAPAARPNRDRL
jgi:hypothetical protein